MGLGVGLSWLIDSLNSLFFLAFTLHFYYAIVFELVPAIANWEALQPVLVGEVLMLLLCVAMQAVIAFSTNREHAFGYDNYRSMLRLVNCCRDSCCCCTPC